MTGTKQSGLWRVLIASSHPLFAEGLRSLLQKGGRAEVSVLKVVSTIEEAMSALESLQPDLVIVDYDDERVNRDEFLARFVEGQSRLRVVLLSLQKGGDEAVIYDRRSMAASNIDDWLEKWNDVDEPLAQPAFDAGAAGGGSAKPKRRDQMRHVIVAGLVVIGLAAAGLFALNQVSLLPAQASLQATAIDWLFNIHFIAIVVLFALIVGLLVYSIIVFRRRKGDDSDGPHIEGNTTLEVTWTLAPLAAVLTIAYLGSGVLGEIERADPRSLEVAVIGSQWAWRFEYPQSGVISTELHLIEDKQALLHLSSTDVIHSFWVPEFRVKQDALPGGEAFVRDLRVTPSQAGNYSLSCAELCGLEHSSMVSPVIVQSQQEFDAWIEAQVSAVPDDPVSRGKQWAIQFTCIACHSLDGTSTAGPTWKGLYGKQESLADGSKVPVDRDYLYKAIRDPGAQIVTGFQNIMPPTVAEGMSEAQVADVIALIESLK